MAELDFQCPRRQATASKFAEPKERAYSIQDKAIARNAKARASQTVIAGRMSKAEEGQDRSEGGCGVEEVARLSLGGPIANASRRFKMTRAKHEPPTIMLSGGNPQIAKADGDAPVQAYIKAMPGWKRDLGERLDALIV